MPIEKSHTTLIVTKRSVYGVTRVYPACDTSRLFASVARDKTLTDDTLAKLKAAGYAFQCAVEAV